MLSRLHWLFVFQGTSQALLLPFMVPLLDERGLGAGQIGLVLGAAGLVSLLAYPVWGTLADGRLGRRRSIAAAAATAAVGGLLIVAVGSDPVALTLALSVALVGVLPWGPLTDAIALGRLGEGSTAYGRLRVWTSAGWAVAAIAAGLAWTALGPDLVFATLSVSALVVGTLGLLQEDRGASMDAAAGRRGGDQAWLPLLAAPVLLGFMIGLLVSSVGEFALWRYVGLRILEQGGGVLLVGIAAALPALVEIPVFSSSRGLARRLGLRGIFFTSTLISSGLAVLIAFSPEAWMVTALRAADGTSFALRYMGMVLIIGALLPRHLHAMGQSLGWLVGMGIAPIIADALGGLVFERYSSTALFLLSSAMIIGGGAIAFVVLSGRVFRRPEP